MTLSIPERYPYIDALMMGYINQDAVAMAGSTRYEDMIQCYINDMEEDELADVLEELKAYQAKHSNSLTADFMRDFSYGYALKNAERFFTLLKGAILMKRGGNYTNEAELDDMAEWELAIKPTRVTPSSEASEESPDEQAFDGAPVEELEALVEALLVSRVKTAESTYGRGSPQHRHYLTMLATALGHEKTSSSVKATSVIVPSAKITDAPRMAYGMATPEDIIHFSPKK